ncbi:MAG: lytic murein transglycosylase B [Gammaproteobacteria bacterium]|nr:lytic murein transglycosylase B [Gammaproteobacteria bacterium]
MENTIITNSIRLLALVLLVWNIANLSAAEPASYQLGKADFIAEMQANHGFDREQLQLLMDKATYRQAIIDAISRPAEGKSWREYRPIFVTESRSRQGVEFWDANADLLARAEAEYGVPPEIIVAIIGVETRYGQHLGSYPVLDSLSTLAFGYPKRGKFFRGELTEFMLLSREETIDMTSAMGSYAGALGMPQFIPSSYRAYAVDFDADGRRDLWQSSADVIGSVASYFKRHGWSPGHPVTTRASGVESRHQSYLDAGMKPSIKVAELRRAGIKPDSEVTENDLASLIALEGEDGMEYWLGLHNFYVITRYNHSNLYAMAVYQLSQEILRLRRSEG